MAKSETVYKFIVDESYPDMKNGGTREPFVDDDTKGVKGIILIPGEESDPSPDNDVWIYTSSS